LVSTGEPALTDGCRDDDASSLPADGLHGFRRDQHDLLPEETDADDESARTIVRSVELGDDEAHAPIDALDLEASAVRQPVIERSRPVGDRFRAFGLGHHDERPETLVQRPSGRATISGRAAPDLASGSPATCPPHVEMGPCPDGARLVGKPPLRDLRP
jgi:hypothetical protein